MTTSEPNEQPPTNATPGQTGEPPKPARSRRANAAAAQPSPPAPPEAPSTDGDETRPLSVESVAPEPMEVVESAPVASVDAPTMTTPPPFTRVQPETVFVPLAVSIGDGFKFGCGFFLALVMAMLIGFVLLALLFVLSSLVGLNLPITR